MSRCKLESHDGSKPLQPSDIYLGNTVEILSHKFIVLDCDQFTFKFMEENCSSWVYSNTSLLINKVRRKKDVIQRVLLTYPALSTRTLAVPELQEILGKTGLDLVKQEVCTLFRAVDISRVGVVKMTQFLKFIMDL